MSGLYITKNVLEDPSQHLRLMLALAERLIQLEGQSVALAGQVASVPPPTDISGYLRENGQEALTMLNLDPTATARTNAADSAPTASDDSTKGYSRFSRWINTSTNTLYTCVSAEPGNAVWI